MAERSSHVRDGKMIGVIVERERGKVGGSEEGGSADAEVIRGGRERVNRVRGVWVNEGVLGNWVCI